MDSAASSPVVPGPRPVTTEWPAVDHLVPAAEPNSDAFVDAAALRSGQLPDAVLAELHGFATRPPACGALLLDGLPLGHLPPTPPTPWGHIEKDLTSDFILLSVAHVLGHPMGYAAESRGVLTPHIVPTPGETYRQVSTSSEVDLVFHTEGSYAHHKPRYLLLLCLRGDPTAATTLAPVAAILPRLDEHTRQVLSQPRFRIAVDETYVEPGERRLTPPLAALAGDPGDPRIVFDANGPCIRRDGSKE